LGDNQRLQPTQESGDYEFLVVGQPLPDPFLILDEEVILFQLYPFRLKFYPESILNAFPRKAEAVK